jgi:hypothetical protein
MLRTTTWQRPTPEHVRNFQHWQSQQGSIMQQCGQRFLYDHSNNNGNATNGNANTTSEEDASLEPLPDGWERRVDPTGRVYFVNHKNKVSFSFISNYLFVFHSIISSLYSITAQNSLFIHFESDYFLTIILTNEKQYLKLLFMF